MRLRRPGRTPEQGDETEAQPGSDAVVEPGAEVTQAPAPAEGRGEKMQRASRNLAIASAQLLLIAAAIYLLFWILGKLWSILLPIVLGLLIATVLWPATRFLRRHKWPPAMAAAAVLLGFITAFVGIIAAIADRKSVV